MKKFINFQQQEQEVIRLCLKHFRRYNYNDAFTALQAQTKVPLEDKFLTKLHTLLVDEGLFEGTEEFLEKAVTGWDIVLRNY